MGFVYLKTMKSVAALVSGVALSAFASLGAQGDLKGSVQVSEARAVVGVQVIDGATPVNALETVRFTKGDGGKLIFKKFPQAPRVQIFFGFAAGDVTFEKGCADAGKTVSPEWWGAAGNDDPAYARTNVWAINAALMSVSNAHLTVALTGTYYIDNKLFPQSGSTLAGPGTVKAIPNLSIPPHNYLIEIRGQTDVTIDGLGVDGNRSKQAQDAPHTYGGIYVKGSSRCIVKRCNVHDCNGPLNGGGCGNGIRTQAASDVLLSENRIYSNNGCGINIYFSSKRIQAVQNTLYDNTEIGIESEGRNGKNYTDNRNSEICLLNNAISGRSEPTRREDHSVLIDWTDNATILTNQCQKSRSNGIEILGCHTVLIAGNTCEHIGGSDLKHPWAGIRVTAERFGEDGRSSDVSIFDNAVTHSLHGIYLDTVDRVTVGRNAISDTLNKPLLRLGSGVSEVSVSDERLKAP